MMMPDEASDLTAAAAGDWEAFARLYDRHAGMVLSLCRRRSWSLEEAEDATQQTFLRAYPILRRLKSVEALRAWLFRAATRVCSERRRAIERRRRHEMSAASQRIEDREQQSTPCESAAHGERLERLTAALEALPDDQRLAVHLHYLQADPVTAAAGVLGLSRPGFYKLLARARDHLARLLREGESI